MTHPNPENDSTVDDQVVDHEEEQGSQEELDAAALKAELAKVRREAAARRSRVRELEKQLEANIKPPATEGNDLAARLASLEEKLTAAEVKNLKSEIADEFSVPASALRGKTAEELREHAEELQKLGVRKGGTSAFQRVPGSNSRPVGKKVTDSEVVDGFLRNMRTH